MIKNRIITLIVLLFFACTSFLVASEDGVKVKARQAGEYVIVD